MILDALVRHYDRLADDPASGIARFGFSQQQVGFAIVLNKDGSLFGIEPLVDESSGKPQPVSMVVPGQSKPSGKGINPCLLWDNPTYLLGQVPDGREPGWAAERFEAFRDRHLALQQTIKDATFDAICTFLKTWDPAGLSDRADTEPLTRPGFGVFQLRNAEQYAHQSDAVQVYWHGQLGAGKSADDQAATGQPMCLVTGAIGPAARLHEPKIKRVAGAQSSGATLVSYNDPAYESYGKSQGDNAPVSERAAFAYATALNRLLDDSDHRVQLGDTTCVFWAEADDTGAADAVAEAFGVFGAGLKEDDGGQTRSKLADFLARFRDGKDGADTTVLQDADTRFYILGLAPNAARISVRFWHASTVRQLADRLQQYRDEIEIVPDRPEPRPLTIRSLLHETARDSKDIPPRLGGEFARAILLGTPYPDALTTAVRRRIVADRRINHARAAILKAWLNRNHANTPPFQEVPVALDLNRTDPAYLVGRLFAVYEKVQLESVEADGGKLNRTIRDSYLSAASATPASIFPRLYRLNQHHFNKLKRAKAGLAINREKLIGEICDHLSNFPRNLSLTDQGLFAIGYYQQMQDFYKRKDQNTETPNTPSEEDSSDA